MRFPRTLVTLGSAALLFACAVPTVDQARYAQTALLGMPEQTLLGCAGVPDRTYVSGNRQFLSYSSGRAVAVPGPTFSVFGGTNFHRRSGVGIGIGVPLGGYGYGYGVETTSCEATFTLEQGRVAQLSYTGSGPYRASECRNIVESCLALVPPPVATRAY